MRIQGITFPPHHGDKLNSRASCNGFVLVELVHALDCEHLTNFLVLVPPLVGGGNWRSLDLGDERALNPGAGTHKVKYLPYR